MYVYGFEIFFKDGRTLQDEYTTEVEDVACIRFVPNIAGALPTHHFFFTTGESKLERFFGRGFITTGKGKDYCYCIFTENVNIYINAYTGNVVYTDDKKYQIKSRLV
jgi:hypothetical protein